MYSVSTTGCHWWGGGGGVWVCSFFFNDTATTEIYTLSLHDALRSPGSISSVTSAGRAARSGERFKNEPGRQPCFGLSISNLG